MEQGVEFETEEVAVGEHRRQGTVITGILGYNRYLQWSHNKRAIFLSPPNTLKTDLIGCEVNKFGIKGLGTGGDWIFLKFTRDKKKTQI